MYVVENEPDFIYASVTNTGGALLSFKGILFASDDANDLLATFAKATGQLEKNLHKHNASQLAETETKARDPFERLNTSTRSVDIEDVNVGDQIRIGGWWHRVETINERRVGVTVKTTRNEWFAFDHGDRVTIAIGAEDE